MIKVTKQGVTTHLWQLLPRNSFTWSVICYLSNTASLYDDVYIPKMLLAHPLPSRAYFSKLGRPFFFRSWVEAAGPSVRLGPLSRTTWETTCTREPRLLKRPLFFWRPLTTFQNHSIVLLQNIQNICLLQPGRQPAPGDPCCSKESSSFEGLSQHFNTIQNISKHSDFWKALT